MIYLSRDEAELGMLVLGVKNVLLLVQAFTATVAEALSRAQKRPSVTRLAASLMVR